MTSKTRRPTLPQTQPFDYALLTDRLKGYGAARDKISRLLASGEVVRVKKGLYVAGGETGSATVDPLVLSGLVSGPSCVSFEKALELRGMIPERVEEITCATTQRHRSFDTPAGRFSYFPVPAAVLGLEVERMEAVGGHYYLATPERALCDCAARLSGVSRQNEIAAWLADDLRLDEACIDRLNPETVISIATVYRRQPVSLLAGWLKRRAKTPDAAPC